MSTVFAVALRKESVDRNPPLQISVHLQAVALRKESVDRNPENLTMKQAYSVALRKESVDRNSSQCCKFAHIVSLSARRAWIEIYQ